MASFALPCCWLWDGEFIPCPDAGFVNESREEGNEVLTGRVYLRRRGSSPACRRREQRPPICPRAVRLRRMITLVFCGPRRGLDASCLIPLTPPHNPRRTC